MFKFSKDGVTVSVILDRRRPKQDGKYPVKIQVVCKRIQKYYSTGKNLSVEEWGRMPTTKTRTLIDLRASIENSFTIVRDIVEDLASDACFSFGELNTRLGRGVSVNLNTAFQTRMEQLTKEGRIGNRNVYENTLKSIERFAGTNIAFDSITEDWLRRYEKFLVSENKKQTTISMYLRTLRAIVSEAQRCGVVKEGNNPFGPDRFAIKKAKGHKKALTLEQIGQIAKFDNGNMTTSRYRDFWLFQYFCNGINIADAVSLKYKNIEGDELVFVRHKTENTAGDHKEIRVVMIPQIWEIIKRWGNPPEPNNYIFPILSPQDKDPQVIYDKRRNFNRALNKRMKVIEKALGLPASSTNVARHSYATVLKRSGASIAYISESMGHHNLKTTEIYLDSFETEERKKNASLLAQFDTDTGVDSNTEQQKN